MSNLGNKEIMAQNIKYQMQRNNKKATDVCSDLDIKKNTFSDWVNAKTYPRIDKIEQMASYFHCTKSALVESIDTIDYIAPELNATISAMNDTQKNLLYLYAQFLLVQKPIENDKYPISMQVTEGEQKLIKELRERTEIDTHTLEKMFNTILHYKQDDGTLTIDGVPSDHRVFVVTEDNFLNNNKPSSSWASHARKDKPNGTNGNKYRYGNK